MSAYEQAMRQAVTDLRAASDRLMKLAKVGYMAGPFAPFFDSSPPHLGIHVLPAAIRGCVADANVSTLGKLSEMLAATANDIEQSVEQGWNGRQMPDAEADIDG